MYIVRTRVGEYSNLKVSKGTVCQISGVGQQRVVKMEFFEVTFINSQTYRVSTLIPDFTIFLCDSSCTRT